MAKDVSEKKMELVNKGKLITRRPNGTVRVQTVRVEGVPKFVDKSFFEETEINNIMAKYRKTGQITHLAKSQGMYADVSNIPDLAGAISQIQLANEAFRNIPSEIRARFDNDPVKYVEFLKDPKNTEESIKLGLRVKPRVEPNPVLDELKEIKKSLAPKKNESRE